MTENVFKIGDLVRFNHERDSGPDHRVVSVMRDGMIEIHDMGGYFSPHLFVAVADVTEEIETTDNVFEAKAREIHDALNDSYMDAYPGEAISLIASALKAEREEERERAAAAVIAQAYWRHQGATPDRNTQTDEEIYAQNEAYERRCLLYMTGELDEHIEPLSEIQWREIRRRAEEYRERAAIRKRSAE